MPAESWLAHSTGSNLHSAPFGSKFNAPLARDGPASMWCDRCRADAAAEVSSETGIASCATCGSELGVVRRPASDQARELLKRWSAGIDLEAAPQSLLGGLEGKADPMRPVVSAVEEPQRRVRIRRPVAEPQVTSSPQLRVDPPHRTSVATPMPTVSVASPRIDASHVAGPAPPHFDVHTAIATKTERTGSGSQLVGQILAYSGVLTLTLGTALIIWGYFGGPPDYAPTGWLVATGGQMLLFLGVVTLVAGGLEQTNRDVRVRVESLGERLLRIEQATSGHALQGPHSPPAAYSEEAIPRQRPVRGRA